MVDATIESELTSCLGQMPVDQQRKVLEFARTLVAPVHGVRGSELLRFAGAIEASDLEEMSRAIENGCEKVDADEW